MASAATAAPRTRADCEPMGQSVKPIERSQLSGAASGLSCAQASGGWTLTWQGGTELDNDMFPGATSIFAGIEQAARSGGGSATLSES